MCSSRLIEWREEAQKAKWECLRAHRKLRRYPRQHLAVMIPVCLYRTDFVASKAIYFICLYRALLRADIQCPWISSERSLAHVQNQVCSSGSLDLQTSSPLGPSDEGLHCLRGFPGKLEIGISLLQQPVFQKDP